MRMSDSVFPKETVQIASTEATPGMILRGHDGLTKRELFAAMAMQGLLANMQEIDFEPALAVSCADALIADLGREKSE